MLKTSLDWRDAVRWLNGYGMGVLEKEPQLPTNEHYMRGYQRGLAVAAERRYGNAA